METAFANAKMRVEVDGDYIAMKPSMGVFPGHSVATELLNHTFWRSIAVWQAQCKKFPGAVISAKKPIDDKKLDVSTTTFVDDIGKTIYNNSHKQLLTIIEHVDAALDSAVGLNGMVQNRDKTEALVTLAGAGTHGATRRPCSMG